MISLIRSHIKKNLQKHSLDHGDKCREREHCPSFLVLENQLKLWMPPLLSHLCVVWVMTVKNHFDYYPMKDWLPSELSRIKMCRLLSSIWCKANEVVSIQGLKTWEGAWPWKALQVFPPQDSWARITCFLQCLDHLMCSLTWPSESKNHRAHMAMWWMYTTCVYMCTSVLC